MAAITCVTLISRNRYRGKKPENLTFEESLCELERIVSELEQGDVSLDDALKQFERGIKLVRNSQGKLEQAQQKVAILMADDENAPLTPFSPEAE
ncbi:exodeoxyribonuclease VII small subunit [Shewanella woodyi]|uniref:exodeoxyribonuclease VII small subunit n=1 Tax=Shewanella woodyi TaxID=60961 RepID=UPI00374981EC